ncbi:MAG: SRPBCC family protein [Pseudomonadota bacterium]
MNDKKTTVHVTREIAAPASTVWATVRDFAGITKFLPMFELVGQADNNIGSIRALKQGDAIFRERLEALDDVARIQRYSIVEAPVPFQDYLGELAVRDLGNNRCVVSWSSTFIVVGAPEAGVTGMVEGLYNAGIDQLVKLHA